MNFEAITKADLIKKAKDYKGDSYYIPVKDLDLLCALTACSRDEMLDFLEENGVSITRNAYTKKEKKTAEGKDTDALKLSRDLLGDIVLELIEHGAEELKALDREVENAEQRLKEAREAAAAADARLDELDSILGVLKSGGKVVLV